MSDRPCNRCNFEMMKRHAQHDKHRIIVRPARKKDKYFLGGVDIYRFPKALMTIRQFNGLTPQEQENFWICWFMELPDNCAC